MQMFETAPGANFSQENTIKCKRSFLHKAPFEVSFNNKNITVYDANHYCKRLETSIKLVRLLEASILQKECRVKGKQFLKHEKAFEILINSDGLYCFERAIYEPYQ